MSTGTPRPIRARPLVPAPPGSGSGFLAIAVLAAVLPLTTSMALGEWTARGVDAWLDRIGWTTLLSFGLIVPPFLGWPGRHFWSVCAFWTLALVLLAAYPICLGITAAVPLGWRPAGVADERVVADYAFGVTLVCAPGCVGLLRLLRLRYFQPWTMPEDWETAQSRTPAWAMAVLRFTRPGIAASIDRQRAAADAAGQARSPRPPQNPRGRPGK